MTDTTASPAPAAGELTFLGHPRGLVTLFFTEMWERFSFYGMRALLVIYLTQHFLFTDDKAQGLYGAYAALVYLMPVIGGVIADRFLGARKAVTIGAVLLVLGHFGMAFEGSGAKQYLDVDGQQFLVTSVGRGEDQELTIALPEGIHRLRFDEAKHVELTPIQGGDTRRIDAGPDEKNPVYQIASATPSLVWTLCGTIGLRCGDAPATSLVVGDASYPIRQDEFRNAETGKTEQRSLVNLDGAVYALQENTERRAIAFNPGASDEKTDDTIVRSMPACPVAKEGGQAPECAAGGYSSRVEQDSTFVQILYLSLALIIVGVGFLKANISTTVGALYAPGDPRRDGGFTIFYMGINLGAFLATLLCGYLGQTYGWKYGFGLAGIGMLFGLTQYLMGQKHLMGKAEPPRKISAGFEGVFWIGGLIAVIPAWLLVQQSELMEMALPILVPAMFAMVLGFALVGFKGRERGMMIAALVMIFFSVVFWMLFEQAGSSLSLFAERSTDLTVFPGVSMTAAQTQSFNAGFIVLLALPFSAMWVWLNKRKFEPSTPVKFALGLIQVGLGFFIVVFGAQFAGDDFKVPLIFLALLYLLHTTGELFLSPVGLSMVTKLSPARVVGLMMGVWFLSSSLAHILAAIIAQRTSADTIGGQVIDRAGQLQSYVLVFTSVGIIGVAAGLVLLLISPVLKRWMGDVN
jgi:amino acid/peptide:H+ symporter